MRSYSSLLGHLLASTGEIDGYCELHQSYASELDLVRMALDVQNTYAEPLTGDRLFDKLLHRGSTLNTAITDRSDVHVILAARTPAPTLASMIALGTRDSSVRWASNPARALLHYQRRLDDLQALATTLKRGAVLIADEITRDSESTRRQLAAFLGLPSIPDRYKLRARTGHAGFGDSSTQIMSGSIQLIPTEPRSQLSPVSAEIFAEASESFAQFVANPAVASLNHIGEYDRYRIAAS